MYPRLYAQYSVFFTFLWLSHWWVSVQFFQGVKWCYLNHLVTYCGFDMLGQTLKHYGMCLGHSLSCWTVFSGAGHNLIKFWYGAHQINLVATRIIRNYCNENWYYTFTGLIEHPWCHNNLVNFVQTMYTKVAATIWMSLCKVLRLLAWYCTRLIYYLEENNP